jgi:hypothetical protein
MPDGATYLVMPDGSVRWEPDEPDIEAWREEVQDLAYDPEWD